MTLKTLIDEELELFAKSELYQRIAMCDLNAQYHGASEWKGQTIGDALSQSLSRIAHKVLEDSKLEEKPVVEIAGTKKGKIDYNEAVSDQQSKINSILKDE